MKLGDTLRLVTAVVEVRDKTDTLSYYTCVAQRPVAERGAASGGGARRTPRLQS